MQAWFVVPCPRRHRLAFEPDSPRHGAIFSGYFLSAKYLIWIPKPSSWPGSSVYPDPHSFPGEGRHVANDGVSVECPVFFGPLATYNQAGDVISVTAGSKEARGLAPHEVVNGYTIKKGTTIHNAIHEVLDRIGEAKYDLPHMPWKLVKDIVVAPGDEPWHVIDAGDNTGADTTGTKESNSNSGKDKKKQIKPGGLIAQTGKHPHHIYYTARGHLKAKRLNKESVYTFEEGVNILTEPTFEVDESKFVNTVVVEGAAGKGKSKKKAKAIVCLPPENPLSPESLGRNGKRDYRPRFVSAPNLKTDRDCRQRGRHLLHHAWMSSVNISFDAPPVPMLEEWDVVTLKHSNYGHFKFPLKTFTLPLTSDQNMTIGATKRIRKRKHGGKDDSKPRHRPRHRQRQPH